MVAVGTQEQGADTSSITNGPLRDLVLGPRTQELIDCGVLEAFPLHITATILDHPAHGLEFLEAFLSHAFIQPEATLLPGNTVPTRYAFIHVQNLRELAQILGWNYDTVHKYVVIMSTLNLMFKKSCGQKTGYFFLLYGYLFPESLDQLDKLIHKSRPRVQQLAMRVKSLSLKHQLVGQYDPEWTSPYYRITTSDGFIPNTWNLSYYTQHLHYAQIGPYYFVDPHYTGEFEDLQPDDPVYLGIVQALRAKNPALADTFKAQCLENPYYAEENDEAHYSANPEYAEEEVEAHYSANPQYAEEEVDAQCLENPCDAETLPQHSQDLSPHAENKPASSTEDLLLQTMHDLLEAQGAGTMSSSTAWDLTRHIQQQILAPLFSAIAQQNGPASAPPPDLADLSTPSVAAPEETIPPPIESVSHDPLKSECAPQTEETPPDTTQMLSQYELDYQFEQQYLADSKENKLFLEQMHDYTTQCAAEKKRATVATRRDLRAALFSQLILNDKYCYTKFAPALRDGSIIQVSTPPNAAGESRDICEIYPHYFEDGFPVNRYAWELFDYAPDLTDSMYDDNVHRYQLGYYEISRNYSPVKDSAYQTTENASQATPAPSHAFSTPGNRETLSPPEPRQDISPAPPAATNTITPLKQTYTQQAAITPVTTKTVSSPPSRTDDTPTMHNAPPSTGLTHVESAFPLQQSGMTPNQTFSQADEQTGNHDTQQRRGSPPRESSSHAHQATPQQHAQQLLAPRQLHTPLLAKKERTAPADPPLAVAQHTAVQSARPQANVQKAAKTSSPSSASRQSSPSSASRQSGLHPLLSESQSGQAQRPIPTTSGDSAAKKPQPQPSEMEVSPQSAQHVQQYVSRKRQNKSGTPGITKTEQPVVQQESRRAVQESRPVEKIHEASTKFPQREARETKLQESTPLTLSKVPLSDHLIPLEYWETATLEALHNKIDYAPDYKLDFTYENLLALQTIHVDFPSPSTFLEVDAYRDWGIADFDVDFLRLFETYNVITLIKYIININNNILRNTLITFFVSVFDKKVDSKIDTSRYYHQLFRNGYHPDVVSSAFLSTIHAMHSKGRDTMEKPGAIFIKNCQTLQEKVNQSGELPYSELKIIKKYGQFTCVDLAIALHDHLFMEDLSDSLSVYLTVTTTISSRSRNRPAPDLPEDPANFEGEYAEEETSYSQSEREVYPAPHEDREELSAKNRRQDFYDLR
ncbi:MAG TPA: hypothetical protein VL485_06875 [Ktedonobacteraceae bacterium]|nr:hypothetical protein [Ktedonobacteraceae bacterium]